MSEVYQGFIQEIIPYYRDIRQKIHANPELRYEEIETAKLVKAELEKLGLVVQEGVGRTGVVAVLDTGKPGKTIALRADMDALPMMELTQLDYTSKNQGKMHACGHDGHTATLLATAHVLSQFKENFSGKIKFIFQPAEEGGLGAKAMIDDGVLENPKVDVIFGYHNYPSIAEGHIQTRVGCIMYGNTEFEIEVQGKSGHAAVPELAINPIRISAQIIENVQQLMERLSQEEPTIITITKINAGTAGNIIPETALITGTIRASSYEKAKVAKEELISLVHKTAKANQASAKMEFLEFLPTVNEAKSTEFLLKEAKAIFGEEKVKAKPEPVKASEDFSFFLAKVPGCFFLIGNGEDSPFCHNAYYDFNDEILAVGVALFCRLVEKY